MRRRTQTRPRYTFDQKEEAGGIDFIALEQLGMVKTAPKL